MDPDGAEVWRPHSWVEEESDAKVPPGGGGGDGSEQPPAVAAPSAAMPAEVAAAMSVKELKAALAKRGVSVSGLAEKADLVAALVAAPPPKPETTLVEVTAMEASAPGTRYFGVTVDKTDKMKLAHWVLNSQPHDCSAGLIELVRALPAQPRQQMLSHLESDLRRAVLAGLKSWPASAPAPTPAPPGSKGVAASRAAAEQEDSSDKDGESGEDDNDGKGVRDGEGDDDNGDGNGGSKDDNDDDDDDDDDDDGGDDDDDDFAGLDDDDALERDDVAIYEMKCMIAYQADLRGLDGARDGWQCSCASCSMARSVGPDPMTRLLLEKPPVIRGALLKGLRKEAPELIASLAAEAREHAEQLRAAAVDLLDNLSSLPPVTSQAFLMHLKANKPDVHREVERVRRAQQGGGGGGGGGAAVAEFFEAVNSGSVARASALLDSGRVAVDQDFGNGMTPLHEAVRQGHIELVRELLRRGAPPGARLADQAGGWEPLFLAAQQGNAELVVILLAGGAGVDSLTAYSGSTAVMVAAETGRADIVRALIAAGADVCRRSAKGVSALHSAARRNHAECLRLLLERGGAAAVNLRNGEGATPLAVACELGSVACAELLLAAGADAHAVDNGGMSTHDYASALALGHLAAHHGMPSAAQVAGARRLVGILAARGLGPSGSKSRGS